VQRWVRTQTGRGAWHWLAVADRRDGLLRAACGRSFAHIDVDLIRSYSEDVPRERRCVPCQAVHRRLIRQPPTIGHRLVEVQARE
jgi:hypothetical protein